MKKALKFLAVALCGVACLSACSSKTSTLLGEPKESTRLDYFQRTNETYSTFEKGVDGFASKFAAAAYAEYEGSENFAVSPISVYMALSLAAECADGVTRNELLSALGVSYETLKENISLLYRALNAEYKDDEEKYAGKVQLGNSIWIQKDTSYKQDCIDSLADNYYCYSYMTDFANANEKANKDIREFVKEQTNGLIDQDFKLETDTLFALINTLYLKEIWNSSGSDLVMTGEYYDFVNNDETVTNTQLLQGYYVTGQAYEEESFTSFYTTTQHGYKIKFIVPNEGYSVGDVFTAENIAKVNSITDYNGVDEENKIRYHTRCLFPEFNASYNGDIINILRQFGISTFFTPYQCNFGSLTDEGVFCEKVSHVTKLEVNKTGVEGAAVTVGANAPTGSPAYEYEEVYLNYIVDKAFGFILTDSYDVTLFSGVVTGI